MTSVRIIPKAEAMSESEPRVCKRCGQSWPATVEHFKRHSSGSLTSVCWRCAAKDLAPAHTARWAQSAAAPGPTVGTAPRLRGRAPGSWHVRVEVEPRGRLLMLLVRLPRWTRRLLAAGRAWREAQP